jgi:hypothetical protein
LDLFSNYILHLFVFSSFSALEFGSFPTAATKHSSLFAAHRLDVIAVSCGIDLASTHHNLAGDSLRVAGPFQLMDLKIGVLFYFYYKNN